MTKKLKEEYQPGGSKRHVILQKAVEYLRDPRFGLQGDKQSFLMDKLGLSNLPKVGTEVSFMAKAVVKGTSAYETQGGSDMRVELQITDMEMKADQTERNNAAASMLYSGQAS